MRALLLVPVVLVLACGGGGGGDGGEEPPPTLQVEFFSIPEEDGFASSEDDAWQTTGGDCLTGDRGAVDYGINYRQTFCFDVRGLPAGSVVTEAYLVVRQIRVQGDPYGKLGQLVLDLVQLPIGTIHYDAGFHAELGALSGNASLGSRSLTITDAIRGVVGAGWTRCQLRLRWYAPVVDFPDHVTDYVVFSDGESLAAGYEPPTLVVRYREP